MQETQFRIGIVNSLQWKRKQNQVCVTGGHLLTPLATELDLCVLTVPLTYLSFCFLFPPKNIVIKV